MIGLRLVRRLLLIASLLAGLGAALATVPATAATTAAGTVISTRSGAFGTMLMVGSGKYAGYTVYMLTSDQPPTYGCTTTTISLLGMPIVCTGPSSDMKAEWPAVTTTAAPVAGPGVSQKLLGTVHRAGLGEQVTYGGHPLYLFEQSPDQITGEAWDEPDLPPWHGLWYLVTPAGGPLAWPGMLTTMLVKDKTVLAALMFTLAGWEEFPVYSYSTDTSTSSTCTGTCSVAWPPMLSSGHPALLNSLSGSKVGLITRSTGGQQLSYDGKPLYFFAKEGVTKGANGFEAEGTGAGVKTTEGTFNLVTP